MGIKALRFDEAGVKSARRHPLLAGKKMLGRGMFSAVYEGSSANTVFKLSVDQTSYWMLNDCYVGVKHEHFPRVHSTEGEVGETRFNGHEFPIYLYEIERLDKIQRGTPLYKLAKQICTAEQSARSTATPRWQHERYTAEKLREMADNPTLPKSIRVALLELENFCLNVEGAMVDMHSANFMARAGELVLTDPIADKRVWDASHRQLHARGW